MARVQRILEGLNPDILVWARESSGLSAGEVAQRLNKSTENIEAWEKGLSTPTFVQLETLAYKVYKRPVAIFFFPEPPDEAEQTQSFRTLPTFELEHLEPDVRLKIRDIYAKQLALYDLAGGQNKYQARLELLRENSKRSVEQAVSSVRLQLGISIEDQEHFATTENALKAWRSAIENQGVFVFKNSLKTEGVSGFCLSDEVFPLIFVNNSTSKSRQIFTLFHELAHVIVETSGITAADTFSVAEGLSGSAREIEVFCNRFAGEFLIPEAALRPLVTPDKFFDTEFYWALARRFNVSREVVLRRSIDLGMVPRRIYDEKAKDWTQEYIESQASGGGGGGSYYANQNAYLSDSFKELAFGRFYEGRIDRYELADILGIKVSSIDGLENMWVSQSSKS